MTATQQEIQKAVEAARKDGNDTALANSLIQLANAQVQSGQFAEGSAAALEAAHIHRAHQRPYDEARCLQFAATLARFAGDLDTAWQHTNQARRLARKNSPLSVAIMTERGEIALGMGAGAEAAEAYRQALIEGKVAGLKPEMQANLLRKRAQALTMAGRYQDAEADLIAAHPLMKQSGDDDAAIQTLIERASLNQQFLNEDDAKKVWNDALAVALAEGNHRAQAELYLLRAAKLVDQREIQAATSYAEQAREQALTAVAPVPYISASAALAQMAEIQGNLVEAYEYLAVAWVTVADLLGQDLARQSFEPLMTQFQDRVGEARFNQARQNYESRRQKESSL